MIHQPPPPPPPPETPHKALFTAGWWLVRGGLVEVITLFFVVLVGFSGAAILLYRITTQLQQADQAIGALMQTIFKKLENIPDGIGDHEPINPLMEIFAGMMKTK